MTTLVETYKRLKAQGVQLISAVDIGAHNGEWFEKFRQVFPQTEVLSVEANPENMASLRAMNSNCLNVCLGEATAERVLYLPDTELTDNNTGASLYKERLKYYDKPRKAKVQVRTLDSLNLRPDLIKLDVQGAELEILRAGVSTLAHTKVVQAEISMVDYNEGSPNPSDLISFLNQQGFALETFFDIVAHRKRVIFLDALFVKRDLSFLRRSF